MTHPVDVNDMLPVLTSAQRVLELIQNGRIFSDADDDQAAVVDAADKLEESLVRASRVLVNATVAVSPFLSDRPAILVSDELQRLVLFLFNGEELSFQWLFDRISRQEAQLALRCIASYAAHRKTDAHFTRLAAEILDLQRFAA